jgi:hypothetical protein
MVAALAASTVTVAGAQGERIAEVRVEGGVATWQIQATDFEATVLTLAPVGGDPVTFDPWPVGEDPAVSGLEDGLYKYDLYLVPNVPERRALAVGDGETDENGRPVMMGASLRRSAESVTRRGQSGSFSVSYGEIVDPDLPE